MSADTLTPKARAALVWFRDNGPVGWFGMHAPSDAMRRALIRRGFVEPLRAKDWELIKYQISDAGRAALGDGASS